MKGYPLTRRRVHMCPVCDRGCMCSKGWTVLDANPSRELNELRPEECDCCHGTETSQQERRDDAHGV
jgi:hypothetical protein